MVLTNTHKNSTENNTIFPMLSLRRW